ncbi:MAG: HAD family hydrolase [Lachnospiraceae bacterium]|nr:HAD family hydrolase [Lachnospiraceae bacterium]
MGRPVNQYKALVFDLDGTLYYQKKLRIKMAWMIGSYYLCHFWRIKELFIIKKFREVREDWDKEDKYKSYKTISGSGAEKGLEERQYLCVADLMGTVPERVKNLVETWIYEKPLKLIYITRDRELISFIKERRKKGQKIIVFSDYPIEDKLKVLELGVDGMYASTDDRIKELKPSPKGLFLIMEDHKLDSSDILMIGDRMSRDGEAAINANCDYIILPGTKRKRMLIYNEWRK